MRLSPVTQGHQPQVAVQQRLSPAGSVKPAPVLIGFSARGRVSRGGIRDAPQICKSSWSSGILQNIAKLALQSQLKKFDTVDVAIDSNPGRLLEGTVDGVVVRGQGWQSPLGLSARLLEVKAGLSILDIPGTLQTQNVQLKNTPQGQGRVRFTTADFRNFVRHPLMETALKTAVQGKLFQVEPTSVEVVVPANAPPFAHFKGTWSGDGEEYSCTLIPSDATKIVVTCDEGSGANKGIVSSGLSEFFSELTLELKGAFFTFTEMRIGRSASTKEPIVDLKVSVRVEKFPPLNQLSF